MGVFEPSTCIKWYQGVQPTKMQKSKVTYLRSVYTDHNFHYSRRPHNDVSVNDGSKNFCWETLHKLIVEENYLAEQIFNMDGTSLFLKRMPEKTFIHKESKSIPGCKVCVSTLYDVRTTTKSLNDSFLATYPCR
jgi:hypothetical protein